MEQARAGVTGRDDHHDAGGRLSFDSSLQRVNRTTFRRRTTPGIDGNVRRFGRVGVATADPGRRKEPLHALDVSGGSAVARVHVAATDPLCAGGHPNLVTYAVVTDRCAGGVRAVEEIIARECRIVPARVADAIMNGVVPVVIVVGNYSIPATVVRFKRIMRPAHARVCAGNDNLLPGETQRPDLGGVRVM